MKLTVNTKYIIIQGLFWMLFCIGMGFMSLYLLEEGVSNLAIGFMSASFGVISAILQPILGRICDRNAKYSWKNMSIICAALFAVICLLMLFFGGPYFSIIAIGMMTLIANLIMPFINSALFYYKNAGENINFGVARGTGSLMYALISLIAGNLAAIYGTKVVPALGVTVALFFIFIICSMPYDLNKDTAKLSEINRVKNNKSAAADTNEITQNPDANCKNGGSFIKDNKIFLMMLLGFILLSSTHNITCNFGLQIINNLGGDSTNLGTTMAIQAMVEVPVLFCFAFLIKKINSVKLLCIAAIGYVLKATCYYLSGTINMIYITQLFQIFSFAIFASASVYYTEDMVDEKDRTTGQALMAGAIVAGNVVGSSIGGFVLDAFGVKNMLLVNIILGVVGACIALIAAGYSEKLIKSRR